MSDIEAQEPNVYFVRCRVNEHGQSIWTFVSVKWETE